MYRETSPDASNITGLIPGNYAANCIVDQADLDLVLFHWGEGASPAPDGWTSQLPLGAIDQDELDAVLLNWGNPAAPIGATSIPEPNALHLLLIAWTSLLATRRTRP